MNLFAEQLKYIRRERGISQKLLAEALGIGQTTIANYERGTRTPNVELIGKMAIVLQTSVDELIGMNAVSAETAKSKVHHLVKKSYQSYCDQLLHELLKGDLKLVMGLVDEIKEMNLQAIEIYEHILTPCLVEIGDLWESGEIDVHTEHYMTFTIETIIGHLMQVQLQSTYDHRRFIGLAIEGEGHVVGIKMINHLMMLEGWQTYFIGNNISNDLVITALKKQSTDVLAISCTIKENVPNIEALIQRIKKEPLLKELKIIVGGQAIANNINIANALGADAIGIDLSQTIHQIKRLVDK
jgi:methanogenic corrinoid protein MtbC1